MNVKETIEQVRDLFLMKNVVFKAIAFVLILLCFAYLIDEILGYSYFSISDKKINQIEKIERLKTTYSKDTAFVAQLNQLKDDIFDYQKKRPKIWSYLPDSLSLRSRSTLANNTTVRNSNDKTITSTTNNISIFYQILSTSFLFIMIAIFMPFVMLFEKNDMTTKAKINMFLAMFFGFFIVIIGNSLFITWLIPDLENQNLKYAINMAVHFSIIGIFAMVQDWYNKKTKPKQATE